MWLGGDISGKLEGDERVLHGEETTSARALRYEWHGVWEGMLRRRCDRSREQVGGRRGGPGQKRPCRSDSTPGRAVSRERQNPIRR